ncbi:MAG TPA: phosphatase domain-containing protein [Bdellovibrionota bacterium]|jgi:phosphatidate phosphatase APP1
MENPSGSPLLLISDLDDTIKISHTQSKLVTVYRGLFRTSAFAGMAQLYTELLARNPGSTFIVVSSSPPQIRRKVEFFLSSNGFPKAKLVLRDWIRQTSIIRYKLKAILELVEKSAVPVLLIGDDTEHDPEVFARVALRHPKKVAARYLRVVKGRELPEGSQGFFTAFDLACAELSAGRLESAQVLRVGEAVLKAEKSSRLIPWFSILPPANFAPRPDHAPDSPIAELWKKIHARLQAIGKERK